MGEPKLTREQLKSRLGEWRRLNGVLLPGWAVALQPFHLVARALSRRSMFGPEALAPQLQALHAQARADAVADLRSLGYAGCDPMIAGYLGRFRAWYYRGPDAAEIDAAAAELEGAASEELLSLLPVPLARSRKGIRRSAHGLRPPAYRAWRREADFVVRAALIDKRALKLRPEYLRLAAAGRYPDRKRFLDRLEQRLKGLLASDRELKTNQLEAAIGASAADSSKWRLEVLRWNLELSDLVLEPHGTYLSERQVPSQLQVVYAVDSRLRQALAGQLSSFAVSKIVDVTLKVYGGPRLSRPGDVDSAARNSIEKLRWRISPGRAAEATDEFVANNSHFELVNRPDGRVDVAVVGPEGHRKVVLRGQPSDREKGAR